MKSLKHIRKRYKRCFELTAHAMMNEPEEETNKWRLVHGTIRGWIRHAWIDLRDGRIYESRDHRYYTRKEFNELFSARPVRTYTRISMAKAICKCGYYSYCFGDLRGICGSCSLRFKGPGHDNRYGGPICDECNARRSSALVHVGESPTVATL
jgi:hypothetical protein